MIVNCGAQPKDIEKFGIFLILTLIYLAMPASGKL